MARIEASVFFRAEEDLVSSFVGAMLQLNLTLPPDPKAESPAAGRRSAGGGGWKVFAVCVKTLVQVVFIVCGLFCAPNCHVRKVVSL